MSEHMITTLTLFKQVTKSDKYETTKTVSVVLERTGEQRGKRVEAVQCAHWSKGPRGGYSSGTSVGFTLEEFELIHLLISVLNYGLSTGLYETVLNVDKPWTSEIRCNRCEEIIDTEKLTEHRNSEKHRKNETLSA